MCRRDEEVPRGLPKQISGPKRKLHSRWQTEPWAAEAEAALVAQYITLSCSRPTLTTVQLSKLERWGEVAHLKADCYWAGQVGGLRRTGFIWADIPIAFQVTSWAYLSAVNSELLNSNQHVPGWPQVTSRRRRHCSLSVTLKMNK